MVQERQGVCLGDRGVRCRRGAVEGVETEGRGWGGEEWCGRGKGSGLGDRGVWCRRGAFEGVETDGRVKG